MDLDCRTGGSKLGSKLAETRKKQVRKQNLTTAKTVKQQSERLGESVLSESEHCFNLQSIRKAFEEQSRQVAIGNNIRIVDSALGKGSGSRGSLEVRLNAVLLEQLLSNAGFLLVRFISRWHLAECYVVPLLEGSSTFQWLLAGMGISLLLQPISVSLLSFSFCKNSSWLVAFVFVLSS